MSRVTYAPRTTRSWAAFSLCTLFVLVFVWRLGLAVSMRFGPDEMEHLHASWCISKGLVIYRDFFEHHPPALYVSLAPVFLFVDVEAAFETAWAVMLGLRGVMWLLAGAAVALVWKLGRAWRGPEAGAIAAAFLAVDALFVDKSTEVRPDGPALVLLLVALLATWRAARAEPGSAQALRLFGGGGVALGLGVLFTQKQLLLWPAVVAAILHHLVALRWSRSALKDAAALATGVLAPLALISMVFLWLGAFGDLVHFSLLLNVGWNAHRGPGESLPEIVGESPFLWAFGLLGLVLEAIRPRDRVRSSGDTLIMATLVCALSGLWILPVVYRQAYLPVTTMLALLAGAGVARLLAAAQSSRGVSSRSAAAGLALGVTALLAPVPPGLLGAESRWPTAILVAAVAVFIVVRSTPLAVPLLAASIAVDAIVPLHHLERRTNEIRIAEMRLVYLNSRPCDTVLDGFRGSAPFRPHASPFFFVHSEIQAVLGAEARAALAKTLRPELAPKIILLDTPLRALDPGLEGFVAQHYVIAAREPIHVRLFDAGGGTWQDDAQRPLVRASCQDPSPTAQAIIGAGWERRAEGAHRFLRIGNERAGLWLPLRDPADGALTLHLRRGPLGEPVRLRVSVNDTVVGSVSLGLDWQDRSLPLAGRALRFGANEIVLRVLGPPGASADVEWVRFGSLRPALE